LRTVGLIAPLVIDGPINGELFRAWVEQMLVAGIAAGDVVVLDNLRSHKVVGIEKQSAPRVPNCFTAAVQSRITTR
jgi:transposase